MTHAVTKITVETLEYTWCFITRDSFLFFS